MKKWSFALIVTLLLVSFPSNALAQANQTKDDLARLRSLTSHTPWLGMIVGERNGHVVIGSVIVPIPQISLKPGDIVLAVNDDSVSTIAQLKHLYRSLAVGSKVEILIKRDNKRKTLNFSKPEKAPRMKIIYND